MRIYSADGRPILKSTYSLQIVMIVEIDARNVAGRPPRAQTDHPGDLVPPAKSPIANKSRRQEEGRVGKDKRDCKQEEVRDGIRGNRKED